MRISIKPGVCLLSTLSGEAFPVERCGEFAANGESLEVFIPDIEKARIRKGRFLWERFRDFLPFDGFDAEISLGEGATPLIAAPASLKAYCSVESLSLKNETANPTWSFKDRGTLTCIAMSKAMNEDLAATVSTGNMGHSLAAYGAKAGMQVLVFVPEYTPAEKIAAMAIHGAEIFRVRTKDYAGMKKAVLALAEKQGLRVVSGNGPFRVEGYKLTAFEIFEQTRGRLPDYIAVPTSACGHIRGLFKGFVELQKAGLIGDLPKMIVVQAENCSPIVTAFRQKKREIIPFYKGYTVAEAISGGDPPGGNEILDKAYRFAWLAETVSEEEILASQAALARSGYFVEAAAATGSGAVKKLCAAGSIMPSDKVLLMLTGTGLKDAGTLKRHSLNVREITPQALEAEMRKIIYNAGERSGETIY
ncbi:MAG: threonine synthase [Candidatus Neomarinimicrobiota bacterium]|nr:threonine synthase [bacterium]